ncbi:hypothetical protein, partial [Flagellimonas olearia]|uniref:hypothetical protein n=1 Tax=Flagellimonas olearia TaxID=552546 RepID=UPI0014795A08
ETVTSEFTFFLTDHLEENSAINAWDDELVNTEEKLLDAVQDLLPENAPCNTITEDGNSAADTSPVDENDSLLILKTIFQTKILLKKLSKLVEAPALAGTTTKITTNLPLLM